MDAIKPSISADTRPAEHAAGRYALPDLLRGFTLLHMVAYHFLWNLAYLFGQNLPWMDGIAAHVWQQFICWTFILLSGYCWQMGRRQLRRGLTVGVAGALVTLATALAVPEEAIFFGVLTLLSVSTLLMIPLHRVLGRVPAAAGLAAAGLLFFLTRNVYYGSLGFESIVLTPLPESLYGGFLATCLGFPAPTFYSPDYFPVIPWTFLFIAGYFLHRLVPPKEGKAPPAAAKPLQFLGRHTLPIYLLHQPALYGLCTLLFG